jgi:hypothetical protein
LKHLYVVYVLSLIKRHHIPQLHNTYWAGIAQSIWRPTSWKAGVRFLAGPTHFSLLHSVITDSRAHPASYPMGIGALS